MPYNLNSNDKNPTGVQWDGKYVAVGNRGSGVVYRIDGSTGKTVQTITLKNATQRRTVLARRFHADRTQLPSQRCRRLLALPRRWNRNQDNFVILRTLRHNHQPRQEISVTLPHRHESGRMLENDGHPANARPNNGQTSTYRALRCGDGSRHSQRRCCVLQKSVLGKAHREHWNRFTVRGVLLEIPEVT